MIKHTPIADFAMQYRHVVHHEEIEEVLEALDGNVFAVEFHLRNAHETEVST